MIWTPPSNPNHTRTHTGRVIAMGPPALACTVDKMGRCVSSSCAHPEVPHGFEIGDEVIYHYVHHQAAHTRLWPEDGKPASWVPQTSVDAVIE